MSTISVPSIDGAVNPGNLSTAQTGTGVSTNVIDRYGINASVNFVDTPAIIRLSTTVGGGPSGTFQPEFSVDGVNFFVLPFYIITSTGTGQTAAAPMTLTVTAVTLGTAAASFVLSVPGGTPWRFLRLNYLTNVNHTITADIWMF